MPNRRTGLITSLLLTAALMLALPGAWKSLERSDTNRMAQILRPPRLRTLTVWVCSGVPGDHKFLRSLCAAFEKEHPGARIFLRNAGAQELQGKTAVLPDVLLFSSGEVTQPERWLVPLEGFETTETSGMSGLVRYAVPLWYAPAYLRYPQDWGDDPWQELRQPGKLTLPEGLALSQLLMSCPSQHRNALTSAAQTPGAEAGVVYHLPEEPWRHLALLSEVSDHVRYAAICRNGEDAMAFMHFLLAADPAPSGLRRADRSALFPNAFAHTREEISQWCRDHFERCLDPAQTILTLR